MRRIALLAWAPVALLCVQPVAASPQSPQMNVKPSFIRGAILYTRYDGVTDDLLTGGLGASGLAAAIPPPFADPKHPTTAELRTRAIHTNYRALVDMTPGGGYGVLYGPGVGAGGEGLIAGDEYIALLGDASGKQNVTLMVQVPAGFDPQRPCIITAASSGSRGIYGAIATSGEWGLKRGCAVAYTDKGTGTGAHDLQDNTVNLVTGERTDAETAGKASNFTARISKRERSEFNADTPDRFAFKHAHAEQNPEEAWGRNVLQSIAFAFYVLNEQFGERKRGRVVPTITPDNTFVIASSVSNGGGAAVRAAELDRWGLIDGVAVSEPNVNPRFDPRFAIMQGDRAPVFDHSRSLYDYITLLNVYQGCANRDPSIAAIAPLNLVPAALGESRCASLHDQGLLQSTTLEAQAAEAQRIINDFGILPEQNIVQPSHWFAYVPQSIAVTYANAYGRARVTDTLCGYGFGATDAAGAPIPLAAATEAALFSASNGIPPTGGVNLINNLSLGGATEDRLSVSPSTGRADQNLDGALCLRRLATASDDSGAGRKFGRQIANGVRQIRASGDLHGIPAVIVTGRADALLPPNHTSRAYFGLNRLVEGNASRLHYYEVTNAQHLDAFNAFPGFNTRFIPLHYYFIQALDLMFDHLTQGAALPPSQVVRTTPRGINEDGTVPDLGAGNLPPIAADPDLDSRIEFVGNRVRIPE